MPGLNPLQNAQPQRRIPTEAPQHFRPFFEQPAKPPPVTIWQPPHIEKPPRSKAHTNRPRTPPKILTAGTWPRRKAEPEVASQTGLFQPKKKSIDEIMWLGSVTGFEMKEQPSMRSKLVRKPEEIASQASAATGPRAEEALRRQQEEEKGRQQRLQQWAAKKDPQLEKRRNEGNCASAGIPIPQPIESRLRPRKKIYTPVQQPADDQQRPRDLHRPHMPNRDVVSFAPTVSILPQPIETIRRSNRPKVEKRIPKTEEEDEGTLWLGLPQLIETIRRSTRKTQRAGLQQAKEKTELEKIPSSPKYAEPILPEPVETTRRLHRPQKGIAEEILPQPTETTNWSDRPPKVEERKDDILPIPIEASRKSNRPKPLEILPEPIETSKRSNRPNASGPDKGQYAKILPEPTETTKRSNCPAHSASQNKDDKTPPTSTPTACFGRDILPQPIETSRRSHRPVARPLIFQPVESSLRSSRMRIPVNQMHLELPQPISVSRWTSRSPGSRGNIRTESTSKPLSPSLYAPPLNRKRSHQPPKDSNPADDHVWHLHEPVDSVPPSPANSPQLSPSASQCPSLSSSPTSTATSSAWDRPVRVARKGGIQGRRGSLEEGFAGYILGLERNSKNAAKLPESQEEEAEFPFPITEDIKAADDAVDQRGWVVRSVSSETIRPALRNIETEPAIRNIGEEPRLHIATFNDNKAVDDYPICRSPVFEKFNTRKHLLLPPTPDPTDPSSNANKMAPSMIGAGAVMTQLPTPPDSHRPSLASVTTAPPKMWYRPTGPSPGYTVASLPPKRHATADTAAKEVTPQFIDDVFRYLSLQFDSVARKFDAEIASYTGLPITSVMKDRRAAVGKYCELWVQKNPEIACGEGSKGGLW